jgi:chorismate dehydratase
MTANSIRVGKFGFVNNFLAFYRLELEKKYTIIEASPGKLAEMLDRGEVVYAPIPSFHLLRRGYPFHRFCVASDGEVYSVIVVSKRKRLDDSPIAITSKSITSANMLRIIARERGMINKLVVVNGTVDEMLSSFNHALVIGDEAIRARMIYRVLMDIGEEWKDLTGKAAVFGISSSSDGNKIAAQVDEDILSSLHWGKKHLDEVVSAASIRYRLPEDFLRIYFNSLSHEMGPKERAGLRAFEEMCYEHGLL